MYVCILFLSRHVVRRHHFDTKGIRRNRRECTGLHVTLRCLFARHQCQNTIINYIFKKAVRLRETDIGPWQGEGTKRLKSAILQEKTVKTNSIRPSTLCMTPRHQSVVTIKIKRKQNHKHCGHRVWGYHISELT